MGIIKNWLYKLFIGDYLGGAIRHLVGILAGALGTLGAVVDPSVYDQFASSTATILVAIGLAFLGYGSSVANKVTKK